MKTAFTVLDKWLTQFVLAWADEIRRLPKPPASVTASYKEVGMAYEHTVTIPALTEEPLSEVPTRKLVAVFGAAEPVEQDVPVSTDTTTTTIVGGAWQDHVTLTLVNVDKGGNRTSGPPYEYDINQDTNPPAEPGAVSATYREVPDPA